MSAVSTYSTLFRSAIDILELFEQSNISWILSGSGGQTACHLGEVSWYDGSAALAICKAALLYLEKHPREDEDELG